MPALVLTDAQVKTLKDAIRSQNLPRRITDRCQCVLLRNNGLTISELIDIFSVNRRTIYNWTQRFTETGLEGLMDKPGRGNKPIDIPYLELQSLEALAQVMGIRKAYQQFEQTQSIGVSIDTVRRRLRVSTSA